MSPALRLLVLLCSLAISVGFSPPVRQPLAHAVQTALDSFDKRPIRTILIIGNSRTYFHDMPYMARQIADSARSPVRYAITTRAWGGATFEDEWKDAGVQQLLQQHWDHVIMQAESGAQANEASRYSFETYGEKLVSAAKSTGSPVALIVNWGYGDALYVGYPASERGRYIAAIQSAHRALARRTGAELINTGAAWEEVLASDSSVPLYEDGNHPTIYGSYLSALMVYGFISGNSVGKASYQPGGTDEKAAQTVRRTVARYLNEPS